MKKKKAFIGIAIFWVLIFGGFIAFKEYTALTGKEVLLKTIPVDPRDLFRGDYVVLDYEIGRIEFDSELNEGKIERNDTVYVNLDLNENNEASFKSISLNKPDSGLFIKGKVDYIRSNYKNNKTGEVKKGTLNIKYDSIESFFVPEGEGLKVERALGEIYTKVAIDRFGNAVIKSLILDGEEINFKK